MFRDEDDILAFTETDIQVYKFDFSDKAEWLRPKSTRVQLAREDKDAIAGHRVYPAAIPRSCVPGYLLTIPRCLIRLHLQAPVFQQPP